MPEKTWDALVLAVAEGLAADTAFSSFLGICAHLGSREKQGGSCDSRAGTTSMS